MLIVNGMAVCLLTAGLLHTQVIISTEQCGSVLVKYCRHNRCLHVAVLVRREAVMLPRYGKPRVPMTRTAAAPGSA